MAGACAERRPRSWAGCGPVPRVLVQAGGEQGAQFGVLHAVEPGRVVHDPVDQRGRAAAAERALAGRGEGEDRAEREDVAGRPGRSPDGLLGREEPRRADHRPRTGDDGRVGGVRDAEVDQARAVGGEHDVGGLEVAVHDADAVHGHEGLGQARAEREDRRRRERPVLDHRLVQRHAGQEGGDEPGAAGVRVGVDHGRGERAADRARRGDLAGEPRTERGVVGEFGMHQFDGDRQPGGRAAEVDRPHTTGAQPSQHLVAADPPRIHRLQRVHHVPSRRSAHPRRARRSRSCQVGAYPVCAFGVFPYALSIPRVLVCRSL